MEEETEGTVYEGAVTEPAEVTTDPDASGATETAEVEGSEGQSYTVKIGGVEHQVSLNEALAGYQRQQDYTQKTQELAEQRQQLGYAERIAAKLEEDPERTLQVLAEVYGIQLGSNGQPVEESEPLDPEEARLQGIEQFIADQQQRTFEAQIQAELAQLHTQYGEFENAELIQFAIDREIPNLADAAKVFVFDRVMGVAQRQAANDAAQQRKDTLPPVGGGHGVGAGAVVPGAQTARPSIREALEAAVAAHS